MDTKQLLLLTYERYAASSDGQQVVHHEQEDGVAQDEGHLEVGAVDTLRRKQEAEEVHRDEEAAGKDEVDHVESSPAPQPDLQGDKE